jgi:hypothetical protein
MKTVRFILALGELLLSPAILLWYGVVAPLAMILARRQQALDFSRQLG